MKYILYIVFCITLFALTAQAETGYVSDIFRITLRSGPGIDHKVTMMLQSGQMIEVLETGDEWTKASLPGGKEGWVLSRFVTMEKPSALLLEQLENKHNRMLTKLTTLREESSKLKGENKLLVSEFADNEKKLNEISSLYNSLKEESADFLALKTKYEDASTQLTELKIKTAELERGVINKYIYAGLSGAGVLLLGFLIGVSAKREQRRSSLY